MYQNTEMYKVASESEKVKSDVRCVDCLKIHLQYQLITQTGQHSQERDPCPTHMVVRRNIQNLKQLLILSCYTLLKVL